MTSKANTVEATFQEIVNETHEAEEITNNLSASTPVKAVYAQPDPELINARIVADHFALEHQSWW